MADPFLLSHIIAPLFFDIGGALSPVSIRDQMIRGRMIVDRAVAERLIDREQRSLLVIGAGAAGVTASIRAAQHGVATWLVDIASGPFSRQAPCTTRWLDPTHYDWPATHWIQGYYPWVPPAMPLPWGASLANNLARFWTPRLSAAQARYRARLHVHYTTRVNSVAVAPTGGVLHVSLGPAPHGTPAQTLQFGMVISCVGFGTERCTLGSYSGYRFWDTDPFEQPDLGLPSSDSDNPRVLISGGGDGALQDYLRILTHLPAGELYQRLLLHPVVKPVLAEIEPWVHSAEDQAQRAYIWGGPSTIRHDHELHHVLFGAHRRGVDRLLRDAAGAWGHICNTLDGILNNVFLIHGRPIPHVELVHSCSHFSRCYGLNHFLVLLVAEYLKDKHDKHTLRDHTKVIGVTGIKGHICHNDPKHCLLGPWHNVVFESADCFSPGGTQSNGDYNVVIIRHGIQPPPLFAGYPFME